MNFYSCVLHPETQSGCADPDPHEGHERVMGLSAEAAAHPIPWVDVAQDALQRGVETAW